MNEQINYVRLSGAVHKDPIHRVCKNNSKMISFCLRTEEHSKAGKTYAEHHMITLFGKLAENNQALSVGDTVQVEGKIHYSNYQKDGAWVNSTSITASSVVVVSKTMACDPANEQANLFNHDEEINSDDVPF